MIEGPEADGQVRGESADPVDEQEAPTGYGQGIPDDEEPPVFIEDLPVTMPAGGGFEPFDTTAAPPSEETGEEQVEEIAIEVEALTEPATPRRSRRTRREPVAA
jgi:single-strand DNA-binding protein